MGSEDGSLARPAQRLLLPVDLAHGGGEVHGAAVVLAVFEAEGVSDLVDDFLPDSVGEDLDGGSLAEATVAGGLEAVGGDDAATAVEVGEAEDVVAAAVEEVLGGDGDRLLAVPDP